MHATVAGFLPTRRLFVVIVALGLFTMAARNAADPDLWWHLKTGQLIVQSHHFLRTDPYSLTKHGQQWINHEWLSDVVIFCVYALAGWSGLILLFGAVIATGFMLLYSRCHGRPYMAGIMVLWGAYASAPSWGVRPQMFSFLLGSAFLLILERSYQRPQLLWWVPPLTLVWVNLHAGYALGISLLALFLCGDLLESLLETDRPLRAGRIRSLLFVLIICLAVVPLNPNGFRMYTYPLETLRSAAMQKYIVEWASPNFHAHRYLPLLLMLLASIVFVPLSSRRVRPRELLILLAATFATMLAVRHIPIYVLVAVPILSKLAREAMRKLTWLPASQPRSLQDSTKTALNAAILVVLSLIAVARLDAVVRKQPAVEARTFPESALMFLLSHHLRGPVLNHYNWGGYFIWKLYPQYQVYIDGRADLYGDRAMDGFSATYYLQSSAWEEPLRNWNINTVVLPPDAPIVSALPGLPGWKRIYGDAQAVILTRSP